MKTTMLFAAALTLSCLQSTAQIKIPGTVSSGWAHGNNTVPANTIIIGNGTTTGGGCVYIGTNAGTSGSASTVNTIVGYNSGNGLTSGWANTFLGASNGTVNSTGTGNTFVGQWCAPLNTTGSHNVFVGQGSGSSSVNGHDNVFVGQGGGNSNTSGKENVFVGTAAGKNNTSGNNNIAVGYHAGFSTGGLTNATAIGSNATCSTSNAMILGPEGASTVKVGIGTATPTVHLHTQSPVSEDILFSTVGTFSTSATNVRLSTGTGGAVDAMRTFMNHRNYTGGTLLSFIGANSAPSVPLADMAGMLTDGASLAIGMEGYELNKTGSIHFVNYVGANRTECMRINEANGFVGVHTRSAVSATGSGAPQALFHVNLTNPAGPLNPLTQGIRFEGLPVSQPRHSQVVVIDPATGDLARGTGGGPGGPEVDPLSWHLTGNAINPGEFLGTTNADDLRIYTNNLQRARVTVDGNFDFGANSTSVGTQTSAAIGTGNNLDVANSSLAAGSANTIRNSSYSVAFGEDNSIDLLSSGCQASGKSNTIEESLYSMAMGESNTIRQTAVTVFAGGTGNTVMNNSRELFLYGDGSSADNAYASGLIGEDNHMSNAHGSFIAGGHNNSDGYYNFLGGSRHNATGSHNTLLGHQLVADISSSTPVSPAPSDPTPYLMIFGERINSNLARSLSVGFNGNRTSVTTERGMSVQIDPALGNTDIPVVNFEAEAGVGTTGRQPLSGMGVQSNIRFHNLPLDPQGRALPAVLIDPATGELFQSQNAYMKPGKGNTGMELDSIYKENETLKNRVSQLESQLTMYDEKFAQLERSLNKICESGCAGLDNNSSDVLYQSIPNPTDNSARVNYFLARTYSDASIALYSLDGKEVRTYALSPVQGEGSVDVVLGDVLPGTYIYRLIVDGKPVAVKKMQKQ